MCIKLLVTESVALVRDLGKKQLQKATDNNAYIKIRPVL